MRLRNTTSKSFRSDFVDVHSFNSSLFGTRATGLLYSLLRVQNRNQESRSKVLLPSITCSSLVHSCLAAAVTPIFYDCNDTNLVGNQSAAKDLLIKYKNELALVVVVHQFGNWGDFTEIINEAKILGITTLEDRCQLLNPDLPNLEADYVLFSFGSTKTLNCKAGAALCSTRSYSDLPFSEISLIKETESGVSNLELAEDYRRNWYLFNSEHGYKDLTHDLASFERYRSFLLWGAHNLDYEHLSLRWNKINYLNDIRRSNAAKFSLLIEDSTHFKIHSEESQFSIPWRFIISASSIELRNDVVKDLREQSLQVSTWYISLKYAFPDLRISQETKSDLLSTKLLNFWVDEHIDFSYVNEVVNILSLKTT